MDEVIKKPADGTDERRLPSSSTKVPDVREMVTVQMREWTLEEQGRERLNPAPFAWNLGRESWSPHSPLSPIRQSTDLDMRGDYCIVL